MISTRKWTLSRSTYNKLIPSTMISRARTLNFIRTSQHQTSHLTTPIVPVQIRSTIPTTQLVLTTTITPNGSSTITVNSTNNVNGIAWIQIIITVIICAAVIAVTMVIWKIFFCIKKRNERKCILSGMEEINMDSLRAQTNNPEVETIGPADEVVLFSVERNVRQRSKSPEKEL